MPSTSTLLAGRYRLTTELGRGGMGVVWQAYDELLHRDVAVKEVHFPADLPPDDRNRLAGRTLREARAVAAVETPAAVRVFDIVEQDSRPWIVMELVRGRTLTAVLQERKGLPPSEVATIGLALLDALETAHAAGVLHRDVKPSNVLIGDDGRIALTDFGIATVDGDETDVTTTGVIVGSPAYVAPERVHGEPSSAASDLWALGATLWTAAEGRPPYAGETVFAVLSSVATTDPPPCSRCAGPLGDVLTRLMDRDPARRPTTATVRAELERVRDDVAAPAVAEHHPTEVLAPAFDRTTVIDAPAAAPAAPTPLPTPAAAPDRSPRRGRAGWVAAALGAAAVVVVAIALVLSSPWSSSSKKPRHARPAPADTHAASAAPATPAGWTHFRDSSLGWTIAMPRGWTQSTASDGTRFTDPAGGRYVLVATRYPAGASAVGAWEDSERAFRSSHPGYQRIRLEGIDVAGARDAADWEFSYVDGGAALHAIDRAMVFGNRGYALYFQTHTDQWDASQPLWERIQHTFAPGTAGR